MPRPAPTPLVVLVGPTAVGKTELAAGICRRFGAEVISADSVALYRDLDIGSAKPTAAERRETPHHLVDVADPNHDFSAADFVRLADQAIAEITARGKRVLVAGGTGLYVKALLHGLAPAPPVDQALRASLQRQWEDQGGEALHRRLAQMDPAAAGRIHPADRQRVIRALEVCLQTGRPFSQGQAAHGFQQVRYPHLMIGLCRERAELFERIELRCRRMFAQGLVDEVRSLLAAGVDPAAKSLGSLGYAQVVKMLAGEYDQAGALEETIKRTKAFAKRQLTWFNKVPGMNWHHPGEAEAIGARVAGWWEKE